MKFLTRMDTLRTLLRSQQPSLRTAKTWASFLSISLIKTMNPLRISLRSGDSGMNMLKPNFWERSKVLENHGWGQRSKRKKSRSNRNHQKHILRTTMLWVEVALRWKSTTTPLQPLHLCRCQNILPTANTSTISTNFTMWSQRWTIQTLLEIHNYFGVKSNWTSRQEALKTFGENSMNWT